MTRPATPVPPTAQVLHFVSVDLTKNRARFYTLCWQPSLWGGGALVRQWGRQGTRGRSLHTPYPDRAAAQPDVERAARRRLRRGYQLMAWE